MNNIASVYENLHRKVKLAQHVDPKLPVVPWIDALQAINEAHLPHVVKKDGQTFAVEFRGDVLR